MCRALSAQGVDTFLVSTNADGAGQLDVPVAAQVRWQDIPAIFFERDFSESLKYSHSFGAWIGRHVADFDLVHIHGFLSHLCLSAAAAARKAGIPYVIRPLGTLAPWSLEQKGLKKRVLLALGARRALEAASAIHCTSEEERRGVEAAFPSTRCVVIPLGLDSTWLENSPNGNDKSNDPPTVLAMSRLHPKKNLEALIEAFTLTANEPWRLVIAGSGDADYTRRLEGLAQKSGVNRVHLTGWADGARKRALISGASLFALVSWQENFGISVLEALASGVPALISDRVDIAPLVQERGAGWVVEPTVQAIAQGLASAMRDDAERHSRAGAARILAQAFAWPGIADSIVKLYAGLLRNGRPSELRNGSRAAAGL
jgi:glycosyltransferase involved in cell wall biosynthesis